MTTTTIRNGVDVDRLVHTISAIEDDLRNFVGIQHGPRPGFAVIRVHGNAEARNATTR